MRRSSSSCPSSWGVVVVVVVVASLLSLGVTANKVIPLQRKFYRHNQQQQPLSSSTSTALSNHLQFLDQTNGSFIEEVKELQPLMSAYFATAEFPGGQVIDVVLDTGSPGLGVPIGDVPADLKGFQSLNVDIAGAHAVSCDDVRCRGSCVATNQPYAQSCGPHGGSCVDFNGTQACSFGWQYLDGSYAMGVLLEAPLDVGGAQINATFGGILEATSNFFEGPRGGGIMGMTFTNDEMMCAAPYTCLTTVLDEMVQQRQVDNRFAICDHGKKGKLILGKGDERLHTAPLQRVPLLQPYALYSIRIHKIMVGDEVVMGGGGSTSTGTNTEGQPHRNLRQAGGSYGGGGTNHPLIGLVDTGTSGIVIPQTAFARFVTKLKEAAPEALRVHIDDILDSKLMIIPPQYLSTLPKLVLVLDDGVALTYSGEDYLMEFEDDRADPPQKVRGLVLMGNSMMANVVILGMPAFQNMYVEFDRQGKTLGIATASPNCEAPAAH